MPRGPGAHAAVLPLAPPGFLQRRSRRARAGAGRPLPRARSGRRRVERAPRSRSRHERIARGALRCSRAFLQGTEARSLVLARPPRPRLDPAWPRGARISREVCPRLAAKAAEPLVTPQSGPVPRLRPLMKRAVALGAPAPANGLVFPGPRKLFCCAGRPTQPGHPRSRLPKAPRPGRTFPENSWLRSRRGSADSAAERAFLGWLKMEGTVAGVCSSTSCTVALTAQRVEAQALVRPPKDGSV